MAADRVELIKAARLRGKLSPSERAALTSQYKQLTDDELADEVEKLVVLTRQRAYKASICGEDVSPYELLQRAQDKLELARQVLHATGSVEAHQSAVKIQCQCRNHLARSELTRRRKEKEQRFLEQLETDQLNESALLIQNQMRKALAKKEIERRRSSRKSKKTKAVVPKNPPGGGATSPAPLERVLPLQDSAAALFPEYKIHDVSGVPITDEEIRAEFQRIDKDGNGYIQKEEFREMYRSLDSFGIEESDDTINSILSSYNMLGDDRLSYDEFAILMLKLAQR